MDWFQCFNCRKLTMVGEPAKPACAACRSKNGVVFAADALEGTLISGGNIYPTKPRRLPANMTESDRRKVVDRIETSIADFEMTKRQPDRWQCDWLVHALACLKGGDLEGVVVALERVKLAPELRSPRELANIPGGYPLLTTAEHRANFERIKSEGSR
jgi:hypothetical protein